MRLGRFCASVFLAASVLACAVIAGDAAAVMIGNWDKSARSWNNLHMTKIKTAMQLAGFSVIGDAPISAQTLNDAVYIIGEPVATPTAAELALLRQLLQGGGMIMVFGDTGIDLQT